jgi:hypothetical protein
VPYSQYLFGVLVIAVGAAPDGPKARYCASSSDRTYLWAVWLLIRERQCFDDPASADEQVFRAGF